jgi:hypothetical protein
LVFQILFGFLFLISFESTTPRHASNTFQSIKKRTRDLILSRPVFCFDKKKKRNVFDFFGTCDDD